MIKLLLSIILISITSNANPDVEGVDNTIEFLTSRYSQADCRERVHVFANSLWYTALDHKLSNDSKYQYINLDKTKQYLYKFEDIERNNCE